MRVKAAAYNVFLLLLDVGVITQIMLILAWDVCLEYLQTLQTITLTNINDQNIYIYTAWPSRYQPPIG